MNSAASDIPLPKDPRHQRFADLRLADKSLRDAYAGAGYKIDARSSSNAKRLEKRDDVQAYMLAIRRASAGDSVLSVQEKRQFLARVTRIPIIKIDPTNPDDPNADLLRKVKRKVIEGNEQEPEAWIYQEMEKLDPLKAIDLDNKLSGDDPEGNALDEFSKMLAHMRNTP